MRNLITAAAAVLVLGAAGCGDDGGGGDSGGESSGEPIKVGMIASLTGPAATFGVAEANGARVVVKDINANGGIGGRPVELVEFDDETDPTNAARGASELINRERVVAILGPTTGSSTLAMAPLAAQAKVPFFSGAGTVSLTDPSTDYYPWSFLSVPSDKVANPAIYEQMVQSGHERIGIFFQEDAFGEFGVKEYQRLAGQGAAKVISTRGAELTASNVTAQATALREDDLDAVVLQTSSAGLGSAFVRAARQVGLDAELYGATGLAQPAFLEAAGPAVNGMHFAVTIDPNDLTPNQQKLFDLLKQNGIEPTGGFGELVYATSMRVLAAALEKSGGEGQDALQDALNSGVEAESYWLEPLTFAEGEHDGLPASVFRWAVAEDGGFKFED